MMIMMPTAFTGKLSFQHYSQLRWKISSLFVKISTKYPAAKKKRIFWLFGGFLEKGNWFG